MHVLHVDDGQTCARGERVPKARHDDVRIHPVDARARGDEAVGWRKRTVLCVSEDPANAGLLARKPPSLSEHRLGWIERIHAEGEGGQYPCDRTAPAPCVENGSR